MHIKGLILAASMATSISSAASPLDLSATVQHAQANAPRMIIAREALNRERLAAENAWAAFFPSLDFTSSHGLRTSRPEAADSRAVVSRFGLSAAAKLYDNGETAHRYRSGTLRAAAAEIEYEKARQQLTLDVAKAFLRFSLAHHQLQIQTDSLGLQSGQQDSLERAYRSGLRTRKDVVRFRAQVQRAQVALRAASNNRAEAMSQLALLAGFELTAEGKPPVDFTATPVDQSALAVLQQMKSPPASASTNEAKLAKLRTAAEEETLAFSRRSLWPEVQLRADLTYGASDYLDPLRSPADNDGWQTSALVGLNYNLWDSGTRSRTVRIAESNRRTVEAKTSDELRSLGGQIAGLMRGIAELRASYALATELLGFEEESYRHVRSEYQQGRLSYLDLVTALNEQLEAKQGHLNAHFALRERILDYWYFEGTIDEKVAR